MSLRGNRDRPRDRPGERRHLSRDRHDHLVHVFAPRTQPSIPLAQPHLGLPRDGAELCFRMRRLLPMDQEHQERLFKNIVDAILAVVHGSLVVAMVQGFLAGLAYWAFGVPFPVLWGVVTAFVALLPVGGSTLVSIPAGIYLFVQGETLKGVLLLAWCLGLVGTIDNVLKPVLIGNRLGLPVLFLFFGILGGLAFFGALGIILGPVVFALLRALLDLYIEEYGAAERR